MNLLKKILSLFKNKTMEDSMRENFNRGVYDDWSYKLPKTGFYSVVGNKCIVSDCGNTKEIMELCNHCCCRQCGCKEYCFID